MTTKGVNETITSALHFMKFYILAKFCVYVLGLLSFASSTLLQREEEEEEEEEKDGAVHRIVSK